VYRKYPTVRTQSPEPIRLLAQDFVSCTQGMRCRSGPGSEPDNRVPAVHRGQDEKPFEQDRDVVPDRIIAARPGKLRQDLRHATASVGAPPVRDMMVFFSP